MSATTAKYWLEKAVDWRPKVEEAWKTRERLRDHEKKNGHVGKLFKNPKRLLLGENPIAGYASIVRTSPTRSAACSPISRSAIGWMRWEPASATFSIWQRAGTTGARRTGAFRRKSTLKHGKWKSSGAERLKGEPAAKAPEGVWPKGAWRAPRDRSLPRLGFRHELASALAALETLRHVRVAGAILDGLKALAINVSTGAGQGRGGGAGVAVSRRPKICYEVFAGSGLEMDVRGVVHGDEIKLEKPLLELDGKRVVVRVEVVEDATDLSPEEQRRAWDEWVARGPQGPIDDEPEWP